MTNGSRVLLAGDAGARPAGLERALTRAGFQLTEARPEGGELALDVVLLTVASASADVLRAALDDCGSSSPPLVALIAAPDPDGPAAALTLGADDAVAGPVYLPELCARLHARIRDRQCPRGTAREGAVRRTLEGLLADGRTRLRPDEVVLALVRRLARAFDLRSCSYIAVESDGGPRLVAEAGQGRVASDEGDDLDLGERPDVAEALRHRRAAGHPDGLVSALPVLADGRVHGVLELVRCEGRPSLTAAQLQFAETLAATALRALEPSAAGDGPGAPASARSTGGAATLDQRLQEEFERARRYSLSFSVVLLEATNGNGVGDTVERMQRVLRVPDFVSCYGGGEYAIVLPETGADGARRSVARVREQLAVARNGTAAEPPPGAGIVTYPHPAVTQADDLFALVEAALARGKAQSGERVGVAD